MSVEIINMRRYSDESMESFVSAFEEAYYHQDYMSEKVFSDIDTFGDGQSALIIFEKYYYRNNSYAALTIKIKSLDGIQDVTIVGYGGGGGLLNLSWGANSNFADKAKECLSSLGFEVV